MISFNDQVIFLVSSLFILLVLALIFHIIIPITLDFNFISSEIEIVKDIISYCKISSARYNHRGSERLWLDLIII